MYKILKEKARKRVEEGDDFPEDVMVPKRNIWRDSFL